MYVTITRCIIYHGNQKEQDTASNGMTQIL